MARASVKIKLRTQEGILYVSPFKADGRKGLAARQLFAALWGFCTSRHASISLCLGLSATLSALKLEEVTTCCFQDFQKQSPCSSVYPLLRSCPKPDSSWGDFVQGPGVLGHWWKCVV